LHDDTGVDDESLESETFKEILTTLRALAANDERIVEYFRAISQGRQAQARGGIVEFDIDEKIAKRINLQRFIQEIELKCWDRLAKLSWRPFVEARAFVHTLKLKNTEEWRRFTKGQIHEKGVLPADIPANPNQTYEKEGWKGMGDWLGTDRVANFNIVYRPFEEARAFVHSLEFKSSEEWKKFCKGQMPEKGTLPADISANPNRTYANKGWKGMGDWLGTGRIANFNKIYRQFEKARAFTRLLRLKNRDEWQKYCRGQMPEKGMLPTDIPANPNQTYAKKGWKGMGDWLGTETLATHSRDFLPFHEARAFVHLLKLKSTSEWKRFCAGQYPEKGILPTNIPSNPNRTYAANDWKSMGDWLGTGTIAPNLRVYLPFEEARAFVRSLNLKSSDEWKSFCKGQMPEKGTLPPNIPSAAHRIYATK
jgi:hypothetical protein